MVSKDSLVVGSRLVHTVGSRSCTYMCVRWHCCTDSHVSTKATKTASVHNGIGFNPASTPELGHHGVGIGSGVLLNVDANMPRHDAWKLRHLVLSLRIFRIGQLHGCRKGCGRRATSCAKRRNQRDGNRARATPRKRGPYMLTSK